MKIKPGETCVVVTMRHVPGVATVNGSGTSNCDKCGVEVNVSPSTVLLMDQNPQNAWKFLCIECVAANLPSDAQFVPLTREQQIEIANHLGGVR